MTTPEHTPDAPSAARHEEGATTVEYGLVTAFVGVVFLTAGPMLWAAFIDLLGVIVRGLVGG